MSRLELAADLLEARKAAAWGVEDLDELEPRTIGGMDVVALVLAGEGVQADELDKFGHRQVDGFRHLFGPFSLAGETQLCGIAQSFWMEGFILGMMLAKVPDE